MGRGLYLRDDRQAATWAGSNVERAGAMNSHRYALERLRQREVRKAWAWLDELVDADQDAHPLHVGLVVRRRRREGGVFVSPARCTSNCRQTQCVIPGSGCAP